jgi:hypothetical protein
MLTTSHTKNFFAAAGSGLGFSKVWRIPLCKVVLARRGLPFRPLFAGSASKID